MRCSLMVPAAAALLLIPATAWSQRPVSRNMLTSDSLPPTVIRVDPSLTYLGTQSFILYDIATAEQHFFAELDGKRVKRFVWVQFEGYLPDKNRSYNYSRDSLITLWGKRIRHQQAVWNLPASERTPPTDGDRARRFVAEHGYSLPASALYHRLVWLFETPARHELMIIYMEDPADYGVTGEMLTDEKKTELLAASLEHAGRLIAVR